MVRIATGPPTITGSHHTDVAISSRANAGTVRWSSAVLATTARRSRRLSSNGAMSSTLLSDQRQARFASWNSGSSATAAAIGDTSRDDEV